MTGSIDKTGASQLLGRWLPPMMVGTAFLLSAIVGLAVSRGTDGIAALWPANAILLSALLLCPPKRRWDYVASCALASVLANAWGGSVWWQAGLFSTANCTTAVVAAKLMRRSGIGPQAFYSIRNTAMFVGAVAVAVAIGATIGAAGIAYAGGDFSGAWRSWASSDFLGMLLLTSLVLGIAQRSPNAASERSVRSLPGIAWPLVLVAIASIAVFSQSRLPLLFVPLAVLVIATYRLGLLGAVAGVVVIAIVGSGSMMVDHGPISLIAGPTSYRVQFFQFYLAVVFGTCLPLATLLAERGRLTQERAESQRRYRRILEQSREVIFETDLTGRWTYLNPAWAELTGSDPLKSLRQSFLSLVSPDNRTAVMERLAALYSGSIDECRQELQFLHANGELRWASVRSRLLVDRHGVATGTYGNIHEVTERKLADAARAESERRYKLLADNSNDMIVRLSLQGVRRYVSPASTALLGYSPEEMLGEAAAGAIHPDDRATAIATCNSLLDGIENPMCIYRQLRKDGSYVWLEASYRLIRDDAGEPAELIATVRDVSRREKAELERLTATAQLGEANRLLLMAEEMSGVGHWRVDIASNTVFWSDVVCAIHGQPAGAAPSLEDAINSYHAEDRAAVQAAVDDAVARGTPFGFAARILRSNGVTRHVVSRGRAEIGPDGSVVGLFGVLQDVTEAHDAERALETTGRKLRDSNRLLTMAETVGKLGHWRIDYRDGSMLWSDEVFAIYGFARDTKPTVEIALARYHPDDVEEVRRLVAEARASDTGYSSQARILAADGSATHVLTRAEVEFDESGLAIGLFGIVQDITERVEAQAELQDREERFRLLTEQASDVISLHDLAGTCLFMSPSVRSVLGYEPARMLGRPLTTVVLKKDRAVVAQLQSDLASCAQGDVVTARFRMRRHDGRHVWIEAAARTTEFRGQRRIVVVSRDVSDQVQAEADLEAAKRQAESAAAAKSSFLANMSHEIRTPMNGVIGFTELLLAGELSDEQRRRAETIADSGRAMMHLLNDILDYSKIDAGQMPVSHEPFDLAQALNACMKLVTPALMKKGLDVRLELTGMPNMVVGDALRLRQVVLNLLGNAAKFTAEGAVTLRATPDTARGGVLIEVEDTGIGISPDRQAAVFDQFVQADSDVASKFGGTGLGLAISARLTTLMGGTLRLESKLGRGTTFFLALPLQPPVADIAPRNDEPLHDERPSVPHGGAGGRVLVAEDHDVNRMLMCEMLTQIGYGCELAGNGGEAADMVARARQSGDGYAVVLMDMQMPEVDGLEGARRIRAMGIAPTELPIIALTANAFAGDIAACLDAGMQHHLAKPVSLGDLRSALDAWSIRTPAAPTNSSPKPVSSSLQQRYHVRRGEALRAVSKLTRTGHYDGAALADVIDKLHKLAGTAGMFGEEPLGDQARLLEQGLGSWSPAECAKRLPRAFEAMRRVAASRE